MALLAMKLKNAPLYKVAYVHTGSPNSIRFEWFLQNRIDTIHDVRRVFNDSNNYTFEYDNIHIQPRSNEDFDKPVSFDRLKEEMEYTIVYIFENNKWMKHRGNDAVWPVAVFTEPLLYDYLDMHGYTPYSRYDYDTDMKWTEADTTRLFDGLREGDILLDIGCYQISKIDTVKNEVRSIELISLFDIDASDGTLLYRLNNDRTVMLYAGRSLSTFRERVRWITFFRAGE